MVSFTLDDLQPLLDAFPAPALLFQDDTLLQLNLAALRPAPVKSRHVRRGALSRRNPFRLSV